jgi:hypothetical protein
MEIVINNNIDNYNTHFMLFLALLVERGAASPTLTE